MLGRRINGRYKLLEVIGGGGMAVVYKAKDLILDRIVAVKVLRSEFSDDDEFIRRFRREAESAASLSHPNIVNIYDIGDEDGIYYIVFEYIDGMTLKQLIRQRAPLPNAQALRIMGQITSAISHAHENGIVHRDIKPHNILINENGEAKVTDFGIALAMTSGTITHTNSVLGSAHYFSPEQARGGYANIKSDIYSLGIVLFEMVTGELPFSGTSPVSVALKHLQENIPEPRVLNASLPQSIENIILKALEKDPFNRYEDVEALQEDLRTALDSDRLHEPKYAAADDEAEQTKMMPPVSANMDDTKTFESGESAKMKPDKQNTPEKKPKKKRWKKWLVPLLLLFLLIGGGVVAAFTLIPNLLYVEDVKVPDVKEMAYEDAFETLRSKNLKVERDEVFNSEIPDGDVVRQNPGAGSFVKEESAVRLFVSKGPESITIDNYVGEDRSTVEKLLEDKGYDIEWIPKESESPEGQIIEQEPDAGTSLIPEQTDLKFTYSAGPGSVKVPDLSGKTKDEVNEILENVALSPNFQEEYSDSVEKGRVIRQDPGPYEEVESESGVAVWISLGKKTDPKPDPEPKKEPVVFDQPVTIEVKKKDEGKEIPVEIYYSDANHNNEKAVDTNITKTEKFVIESITIEPGGEATIITVVNGKEQKATYTYEEMKKKYGSD